MDQFILDFQGFKDHKNKYIVKEIAIISVSNDTIAHCLIKPPYELRKLAPNQQRSANYLTERYHGIFWNDGYIAFKQAVFLIRDLTENASKLFIKGRERAEFIQKLTGKTTIDLDSLECPRVKDLPTVYCAPDCFYYRHSANYHSYFGACSLRRVYKLKSWYKEYLAITENRIKREKSLGLDTVEDEYSGVEKGYDVPPSQIQECLCSRRATWENKFARVSYH